MIQSAINAQNTKPSSAPQSPPAEAEAVEGSEGAAPASKPASSGRKVMVNSAEAKVAAKLAPETEDSSSEERAPQPQQPTSAQKRRIKSEGKEYEIAEADMDRYLSMGVSAHQRWEEAAKMRKEAEAKFEAVKSKDPQKLRKFLLENGYTGDEIRSMSENTLAEYLQNEMLTPEQKRIRELEAEKSQREAVEAEQRTQAEQQRAKQLEQKFTQQYDKEIPEAFAKMKLPADPYMIQQAAYVMQSAIRAGYNDFTWEDAAAYLRPGYIQQMKHAYKNMPDDLMDEVMEEELSKRLRERDLKKLKNPNQPNPVVRGSAPASPRVSAPDRRGITKDDWKSKMDRIKKGLE